MSSEAYYFFLKFSKNLQKVNYLKSEFLKKKLTAT